MNCTFKFTVTGLLQPSRLHYPTYENKMRNTEGGDVRHVMRVVELAQPHVTQYARVHNKLGVLLGPGVGRHQSARRQYNILTGKGVVTNYGEGAGGVGVGLQHWRRGK